MVSLGRKKKAEPAVVEEAQLVEAAAAKRSGFFRKSENSGSSSTPPNSHTPDSAGTNKSSVKSKTSSSGNNNNSNSKRQPKERPTVDTIEVPSPTTTPERMGNSKQSALAINSGSGGGGDSVVSELTVQQDPPARMVRTTSLEAQSASSSHSGKQQQQQQQIPKQKDPPAVADSLVNQVLGMVDLSCVSNHLNPNTAAPGSPDKSDLRQALSFQPEWGVAPLDHHHRALSGAGLNEYGDDGGGEHSTSTEAIGASLTKRELAERAAHAATMETTGKQRKQSKNSSKRHENFELVYKEPKAPKSPKGVQRWVKKFGGGGKDNSTSGKQQQQPLQALFKGGGSGAESTASPTSVLATGAGSPPASTLGIARRAAVQEYDPMDSVSAGIISPKMAAAVVSPVSEPGDSQQPVVKKAGRLRKAFSGKRDEKAEAKKQTTPSAAKQQSLEAGNDVQPPPPQQQGYKKVLKSIKTPNTMPLFTVEEEGDSDADEQFKVRVPGVQNADSFITDKDLIGDEVVEEIYSSIDESIVKEEQKRELFKASPQATTGKASPVTPPIAKSSAPVSPVEVARARSTPSPAAAKKTPVLPTKPSPSGKKLQAKSEYQSSSIRDDGPAAAKTPVLQTPNQPSPSEKKSQTKSGYQAFSIRDDGDSPILRSMSWKKRLLGTKKPEATQESQVKVDRSPPVAKVDDSKKKKADDSKKKKVDDSKKKKPGKPQWKATVDSATGRTYYYHRKTRETTWTKPVDFDEVGVEKKALKKKEPEAQPMQPKPQQPIPETPKEKEPVGSATKIEVSVRKKLSPHEKTKQDIANVLMTVSPSKGPNAERLVAQYEGRDEELLVKLKGLTESQPFDEPIAKRDQRQPDDESKKTPGDEKSTMNSSMISRTRTGMSIYSGLSGRFSRISEKTQQVNNTSNKPNLTSIRDVASATSISTKPDDLQPEQRPSPSRKRGPAKIPKNIPVPRLRELNVEEFTMSDRAYRTFGANDRSKPVRARSTPNQPYHTQAPDSNYLGDNEDTDADQETTSYAATDSISALSDADLSFLERKEAYGDARRRALDRAIAQEDWDLAAQLSEGMRSGTKSGGRNVSRVVPSEWRQSEMDRFISENDWDAVAAYIAQVRISARQAEPRTRHASRAAAKSNNSRVPRAAQQGGVEDINGAVENPQKRFGALSQLQHRDLHSVESYSSYSTYDSEYTSGSYEGYSDDERPRRPPIGRARQPKEFAC